MSVLRPGHLLQPLPQEALDEESGHVQQVRQILVDCDQDCLILSNPAPTRTWNSSRRRSTTPRRRTSASSSTAGRHQLMPQATRGLCHTSGRITVNRACERCLVSRKSLDRRTLCCYANKERRLQPTQLRPSVL
ncbi:MAG: hypothetical protein JW993_15455 [Sedimentisphaerales bacterium]|nr:hypothetical protein [Sedimentisphaerales bacterium]